MNEIKKDRIVSVHMLLTPDLRPIPKGITKELDYGRLRVVFGKGEDIAEGQHVVLRGFASVFTQWFTGHDVVIGNGIPAMESFSKYRYTKDTA